MTDNDILAKVTAALKAYNPAWEGGAAPAPSSGDGEGESAPAATESTEAPAATADDMQSRIAALKAKIAAITGMSTAEQQLAFGSLPLTSGTQPLEVAAPVQPAAPPVGRHALHQASARVGVEGRELDAEQLRGLAGRHELGPALIRLVGPGGGAVAASRPVVAVSHPVQPFLVIRRSPGSSP